MPFTGSRLQLFVFDDLPPNGYTKLRRLIRKNTNVQFINPELALKKLVQDTNQSFPLTFGLGKAGESLAARLHHSTKLFPRIFRLEITRIETSENQYRFAGDFAATLQQFGIAADDPVAIVDDTVYSGGTVKSILECWPEQWRPKLSLFCLQGIAESLDQLANKMLIYCAHSIVGIPEKEVSIIRLSGLFLPGSIRLENGQELAFWQRPEWMQAWFPTNATDITQYCSQLLLDPQIDLLYRGRESLAII